MNSRTPRLVILISGTGSNMAALLNACENGEIDGRVAAVVSNRANAKGLDVARGAGIATRVVDHRAFADREHFDAALAREIEAFEPDLVILAGFMRILTPGFVDRFHGRIMNIHPSLLPKYPGLNTHRRAIEAGDSEAGASVHFVTTELDGGPVIIQARVPVHEGDTEESLASRVLKVEHRIYPLAVQLFCQGRLTMDSTGVHLDGEPLPASGLEYSEQSVNLTIQ
ncbi:MAG: phosphoribosylglycinamide formyltransferase [Porticoccaceae bacterium]|nr:phosphoribosylglycinamide formyltransferase [Porticoccaceae bacterium]